MATATSKLRPPIKRHGGKAYLARRIISLFPAHTTYVEPYLGGGSVLLNKSPAAREIAGDLDGDLVSMWTELAENPEGLVERLNGIPYTAESFAWAKVAVDSMVDVEAAAAFIALNRMSRGGLGKDFAWSDRLRGKRRPGGPIPGDVNAWNTIRAELPAIAERAKAVEFHCADALVLIDGFDSPDTLIYCDPPYLPETRTARKVYAHEMTREDHERLLDRLLACRSRVLLSGYANPLYDEALARWTRQEFDMPNHAGQGKAKQRRLECVWVKPSSTAP